MLRETEGESLRGWRRSEEIGGGGDRKENRSRESR